MGGLLDAPDGRVAVSLLALNDPRNPSGDTRHSKRFAVVELLDARGNVLAEAPCARAGDGRDVCRLEPSRCTWATARSTRASAERAAPEGLPLHAHAGSAAELRVVIGPHLRQLDRFHRDDIVPCLSFGPEELPCEQPGCLPAVFDRDQTATPTGCDVCPDLANPKQTDRDRNGFGDRARVTG
jgi:hypothetical protein